MRKGELIRKVILFLRSYGARKIAIFGSYAKGEGKPDSDIDILVEFSERKTWRKRKILQKNHNYLS